MACDPHGIIGRAGQLPWHYPEELAHFRRTTAGQVLIMGRKTFEAMPAHALTNRLSIVFSRTPPSAIPPGVIFVRSLQEFLALDNLPRNRRLYMIGGAALAALFLEQGLIQEFILTKIHREYAGDTVLNLQLLIGWEETIFQQTEDYTIYKLLPAGERNGK